MINQDLTQYMAERKQWFEQQLDHSLSNWSIPENLKQSMHYSLMAGGKRIRPILLFATLEELGVSADRGMQAAIALEMIHTYSLIHDDLPAMDDDDLRRGQKTNHIVFGEGTAVLAGDGLLTAAFRVLACDASMDDSLKIRLLAMLADAAGPEGMVGGQEDDLEAEDQQLSLEDLVSIHRRKTGRLIKFPIEAGALIAGAGTSERQHLSVFADCIGLAFQIGDDILDQIGDEKKLGKPIGSDLQNHKNTYVSLLTLEGAQDELSKQIDRAIGCLNEIGLGDGILTQLATYLARRTC
ncbi:MAG: polyprenyl synthetase family protein [Sporolactobacillus sp.]